MTESPGAGTSRSSYGAPKVVYILSKVETGIPIDVALPWPDLRRGAHAVQQAIMTRAVVRLNPNHLLNDIAPSGHCPECPVDIRAGIRDGLSQAPAAIRGWGKRRNAPAGEALPGSQAHGHLVEPADIDFREDGHGAFAFGAVNGGMDLEYGRRVVFFTWAGVDAMDAVSGSGSAELGA